MRISRAAADFRVELAAKVLGCWLLHAHFGALRAVQLRFPHRLRWGPSACRAGATHGGSVLRRRRNDLLRGGARTLGESRKSTGYTLRVWLQSCTVLLAVF